jgi:hypothetical protein
MKNWFTPRKRNATLHAKLQLLLNPQYIKERELLEKWIKEFKSPDGETKSIDQFQKTFHSVFLELFLNQLFILDEAEIETKIDRNQKMPDFKIQKNNRTYFIEAVTANFSDSEKPEAERTERDVYGENDHYAILDESISRLMRSILNKSNDFEGYSNVDANSPFVIATGDFSQINYGQAAYFPPLAALYNAYYDPDEKMDLKILCEDSLDREYKFKEKHGGANKDKFELGLFTSEKYKHISAIIYTCTLTLGKLTSLLKDHGENNKYVCLDRESLRIIRFSGSSPDEYLGDGVFIFHNPHAENPLEDAFINLKGVTNFRYLEDDGLIEIVCNSTSPLIRRYVGPRDLARFQVPNFEDFLAFKSGSLVRFQIQSGGQNK